MTSFQRYVVAWLSRRGGAARVAGQWIQREDVRRDAELAEQVYWSIAR